MVTPGLLDITPIVTPLSIYTLYHGSVHGPKVDVPQIISVSFKVVVDGTKSVGPCVALCKQAGRYTRSGMKLSGFWSLLKDGPRRDFLGV